MEWGKRGKGEQEEQGGGGAGERKGLGVVFVEM